MRADLREPERGLLMKSQRGFEILVQLPGICDEDAGLPAPLGGNGVGCETVHQRHVGLPRQDLATELRAEAHDLRMRVARERVGLLKVAAESFRVATMEEEQRLPVELEVRG